MTLFQKEGLRDVQFYNPHGTDGFCAGDFLWDNRAMMVVGLGGMCASLSVLSVKMKKGRVMVLFILSFVCAMAMGYLSSRDSTLTWVNWAEQSINTVSQLCLLLGTNALHKAGLKDYTW